MSYSKEEQEYLAKIQKAFEEQRNVKMRYLAMSKERYQQLAYTYCKITDDEELKDFAYISTHEDVRLYYLSNTNLALLETISRIKLPKNPLGDCIESQSLSTNTRIVKPIKIELTDKGFSQLVSVIILSIGILSLLKLLALLIRLILL